MADALLQRIASGDMAAMQECIDAYSGLIWSLARRFSRSASEAEDGVQEVFIALWENASKFDPEKGAEVTFVAMIARRRLIDRGRKTQRYDRALANFREEPPPSDGSATGRVETVEEAQTAADALEQLNPDQQKVLRLAIHRGYTHEQISEITRMPLGTVKTHARRGLIRVRELLNRQASSDSVTPSEATR